MRSILLVFLVAMLATSCDFHLHENTTRLVKRLSMGGVPTSALSSATLRSSQQSITCHRNRPLFVLTAGHNSTERLPVQQVHTSGAIWLLLTDPGAPRELFSDTHIPFDCQFLVARRQTQQLVLTEVYHVAPGLPLRSNMFGSWSAGSGLHIPVRRLYDRRRDLHGLVLTAGTMHSPPCLVLNETTNATAGIVGNLREVLERQMNFSVRLTVPGLAEWGMDSDGEWSGLMGLVASRRVHLLLTCMTMSSARSDVVSFTTPIFSSSTSVFFRQPDEVPVDWDVFLDPFTPHLWGALLSTVLLVAVFMAALSQVGARYSDNRLEHYGLGEALMFAYGALCQQGQPSTPRPLSARIVFLITYLVAWTVLGAYSGALVSFLAVKHIHLPFNTLEELVASDRFRVGLPWSSATHHNFKNVSDAVIKGLWTKLDDRLRLRNELDGVRQVCADDRFVFIGLYDTVLSSAQGANCTIMPLRQALYRNVMAIATTKGSPYTGLLSFNLLKLREGGILQRLRLQSLSLKPPGALQQLVTTMHLYHLTPVLCVLTTGVALSLAILAGEILVSRRRQAKPH